jgi:DNA-binding Lrp family transcriptional regulator
LEKEGYLKEYTAIPDFRKIGLELLALTFIKTKVTLTPEELEKIRKFTAERIQKTPHDIVMLERGAGLGYEAVVMSFHKNYASYNELRKRLREYAFLEPHIESFLISLEDIRYLPFSLRILAGHLTASKEKE